MKSNKKRIFLILAVLTMALLLSFVFVACNKTDGKDPGDKDLIEPPKKELSASEIYRQVNPSVAFVLIENLSGYSSGSGFFIDSNGTLITNYHVIDDGLSGAIQLYDGTVATIDSVIGYDKNLDIAILSTSAKNTTPVKIADSIIQIGETVYAIGYPEAFKLGFSSSTFTSGMVSMNRSIEGYSYIQSTVNITHGNSGGALINKYGEVIGITTSGITYGNIDYMNLSIPIQRIDTVSRTANEPLVIVTRRKYPVYATFYSDGAKYTTQTLSYEGRASVPTAPVKAGYALDGWYADSSFTEKFDFNKKITSDVSIYAKWNVTTYTIDYNLNSGSWNGSSPSTTYTLNDCGVALPVPTREGYIFEGWKDTDGNIVENLPSSSSLKDLSLQASWVKGTSGLIFALSNDNYWTVSGHSSSFANVNIPKEYRGFPVNSIGSFSGCTNLTSISIPDSVTSIGSNAFEDCSGLTSITIPDSVTNIGDSAFSGCTGLMSITIPDSVTSINASAFRDCSKLTSFTIPNSVTSIGKSAFYGCSSLTTVTIGNSVTSIGDSSFFGCSNLSCIYYVGDVAGWCGINRLDNVMSYSRTLYIGGKKIEGALIIPNGVTSIGSFAFFGCSGLTSITIPDSITSIGDSAFYGCTELTNITVPNNVTSIGYSAFRGCNGLTSITLPFVGTSVTASKGYDQVFGYIFGHDTTDSSTSSVLGATYQYFDNSKYYHYHIPSSIKSVIITRGNIRSYAFNNCTGLTSITIPDSVTSIGDYAFNGCSGLSSITIPDSVTSIGSGAFRDCTGLTSVTIPDSVMSIGDYAFYGCNSLTSMTLPFVGASVTAYSGYNQVFGYIFGYTISDSSVSGATCQYSYGYSGNSKYYHYYIPSSITSVTITGGKIPYCAFNSCSGLTSVTIGNRVTSIGNQAFMGCKGLASITIPDSVTSIGEYAFSGCTGLTSITIPDNVTIIENGAFSDCKRLTSITIPDSVTNIGRHTFAYCSGLTSVTIGNGVTSIGDFAFFGCTELSNVTIGNNVTSIGERAFMGCDGLTSVTIGNGVTSIGEDAFYGCRGLTSITFNGTIAQWNAISKGEEWKHGVPATEVVCTDGMIPI